MSNNRLNFKLVECWTLWYCFCLVGCSDLAVESMGQPCQGSFWDTKWHPYPYQVWPGKCCHTMIARDLLLEIFLGKVDPAP